MFTLHSHGATHGHAADARAHEVHREPSGPLDGELLDLYVAIVIVVPLAWLLKSFLF